MSVTIDQTIEQVEGLLHDLTGADVPRNGPHAPIPPEVDPVKYIEEQVRMLEAAARQPLGREEQSNWAPAVCVWESEDSIVARFDVPGMTAADLELTFEDKQLVLSGIWSAPWAVPGAKTTRLHLAERSPGRFRRTVLMPPRVAADKMTATCRDGVLEVRCPRVAGAAGNRRTVSIS